MEESFNDTQEKAFERQRQQLKERAKIDGGNFFKWTRGEGSFEYRQYMGDLLNERYQKGADPLDNPKDTYLRWFGNGVCTEAGKLFPKQPRGEYEYDTQIASISMTTKDLFRAYVTTAEVFAKNDLPLSK